LYTQFKVSSLLFQASGNKVSRSSVLCGSQNIVISGKVINSKAFLNTIMITYLDGLKFLLISSSVNYVLLSILMFVIEV